MAAKLNFNGDFAILDVKKGRASLARFIERGGQVDVTIKLNINNVHSRDDGVSIEFSGAYRDLKVVKVYEPQKKPRRKSA